MKTMGFATKNIFTEYVMKTRQFVVPTEEKPWILMLHEEAASSMRKTEMFATWSKRETFESYTKRCYTSGAEKELAG